MKITDKSGNVFEGTTKEMINFWNESLNSKLPSEGKQGRRATIGRSDYVPIDSYIIELSNEIEVGDTVATIGKSVDGKEAPEGYKCVVSNVRKNTGEIVVSGSHGIQVYHRDALVLTSKHFIAKENEK